MRSEATEVESGRGKANAQGTMLKGLPGASRALLWAANSLMTTRSGSNQVLRGALADELLSTAQKSSGLRDFGDDFFATPLRMLLDTYGTSGQLSRVGEALVLSRIRYALVSRLHLRRALQNNDHLPFLQGPLFIASLPRTASTFLHRLLALDPQFQYFSGADVISFDRLIDGRVGADGHARIPAHSTLALRATRFLAPAYWRMHPIASHLAEEHSAVLENTFVTDLVMIEPYRSWYLSNSSRLLSMAYAEFLASLRLISAIRGDSRRWLLKSPSTTYGLVEIANLFPEAMFVVVNRDQSEVIDSMTGMSQLLHRIMSPDRLSTAGSAAANWINEAAKRRRDFRASHRAASVCDLEFSHVVSEPLEAIRAIYDHFQLTYSRRFEQALLPVIAQQKVLREKR